MIDSVRGRKVAWLVFALTAAAYHGNSYVYDSIGPVADLLQRQRGFSDAQIGMLNAIYSLPNVVLLLVGGILVDRYGAARMALITTAVCLVGASATNPAGYQPMMLFFGIASTLGFVLAVLLWRIAGRRHHELSAQDAGAVKALA